MLPQILNGIKENMTVNTADAISKFTFGTGTTGLNREAYYAGWVVVGELERQGLSLSKIARASPKVIIELVKKAIDSFMNRKAQRSHFRVHAHVRN